MMRESRVYYQKNRTIRPELRFSSRPLWLALLQPANRHGIVMKRKIESPRLGWLHQHPGGRAARSQCLKVRRRVVLPAAREFLLAFPFGSHLGKDGGDARVLNPVGDHAALSNGAEAVEVLAGK